MFLTKNVLKKGAALLPLLFNFALQYAITNVQIDQGSFKLNITRNLVVYADDINIVSGILCTMKKNTEALVVASKKTGLQANADKTKYLVRSWEHNARRNHIITTDNNSFECVEDFKFWGNTLTNQNSIQQENKSKPKSGNAYYLSV